MLGKFRLRFMPRYEPRQMTQNIDKMVVAKFSEDVKGVKGLKCLRKSIMEGRTEVTYFQDL